MADSDCAPPGTEVEKQEISDKMDEVNMNTIWSIIS